VRARTDAVSDHADAHSDHPAVRQRSHPDSETNVIVEPVERTLAEEQRPGHLAIWLDDPC
jgi:hypothetical protein